MVCVVYFCEAPIAIFPPNPQIINFELDAKHSSAEASRSAPEPKELALAFRLGGEGEGKNVESEQRVFDSE